MGFRSPIAAGRLMRMSRTPYRPRNLQWSLFRGSLAVAEGYLTPTQLRSEAWIRLGRDIYADARVDRDHHLRCRAARLWLPSEAAFAGPSAAALWDVPFAAEFGDPVHVLVPAKVRLRSRLGLAVHTTALLPGDIVDVGDLPRTTPVRTAWDLANWLPARDAVPIIDQLLRTDAVSEEALRDYVALRRGDRGWRLANHAVALADAGAQSPPESRLRVRLVEAGLPRPVTQYPIQLGRFTLRPDLAWPKYRVGMEYDGVWHEGRIDADRQRMNALKAAGWDILHATKVHLGPQFSALLTQTQTLLRIHGWPG